MDAVWIGIIGDYDPEKVSHPETTRAIQHAADRLSIDVTVDWIESGELASGEPRRILADYDGLFASPGFYQNVDGGVRGIQYARESGKPFVGT
jgi:CTP synthase (UTP-ammonia lyase)